MSDSTDKPVSMRKGAPAGGKADRNGKAAGNGPTGPTAVAGGKVEVPRPSTIVALAALMLVAGLFSIGIGLSLHGQHSYLVRTITKNSPPVTAAQATQAGTASQKSLTTGLASSVGKSLTAAQISTQADKVADAIDKALPSKSITKSDLSDQQKSARAKVTSQLQAIKSAPTSAQLDAAGAAVSTTVRSDLTALAPKQVKNNNDKANSTPRSLTIQAIVLTVALGFIAFGAYAGRYWGRWAVPVIWILCTFLSLGPGLYSLFQLGGDAPTGYKATSGLGAAALLAAVILTFMPQSRAWFAAHRPVVPEGAPQRRGMFAPRIPPPTGGRPTTRGAAARTRVSDAAKPASATASTAAKPSAGAARTKKRAMAAEPAAPAAPASSRPRGASKSRRTES